MSTSTIALASLVSSGVQALSMFVLVIITCLYARSTKKMSLEMSEQTKIQTRPAVDVNMIYSQEKSASLFWFSNYSNIPALVDLKLYNKKDGNVLWSQGPLRLSPRVSAKGTGVTYTFGFPSGGPPLETEVNLSVIVKKALGNQDIEYEFEKSYRFHKDDNNALNWDEATWGFRDALPGEGTY